MSEDTFCATALELAESFSNKCKQSSPITALNLFVLKIENFSLCTMVAETPVNLSATCSNKDTSRA